MVLARQRSGALGGQLRARRAAPCQLRQQLTPAAHPVATVDRLYVVMRRVCAHAQRVRQLALERDVSFRWVKGHGTDRMNQLVDELAVRAAQSGRGQSGPAK